MAQALPSVVDELIDRSRGLVLWLTGAGISAESGIPTFRGTEGYWRVGSRNYHPQEMATWSAFQRMPEEVWAWYLYRRGVCRGAEPNAAHRAIADLEERLEEECLLVTQNVDGLHLRAGSTLSRTYQIHGNIDFMRCVRECLQAPIPVPSSVPTHWEKDRKLGELERRALRCPSCSGPARPHVLWFDETYDEPNFRFRSSLRAATEAELLIVVGTTGMTTLPMHIGEIVADRGAPMLVVNPEANPFSGLIRESGRGAFIEGTAGQWVPRIAERLAAR